MSDLRSIASTAPTVTAVIPTFRRPDDLRRCLASLVVQDYTDLEILVVDDAGGDGTAAAVQQSFPAVTVHGNPQRLGAAAAKNEGARRASGSLLWFLDSDVEIPDAGLLSRLVQTLQAHPEAGAVGGEMVCGPDGVWIAVCKQLGPDGVTTSRAMSDREGEIVVCDYLATSSCLVRAEPFWQVGGFDPDYGILSEDLELGYRLRRRGWSVLTGARLAVHHHAADTGRTGDLFLKYRNGLRFAIKNLPAWRLPLLPASSLLGLIDPARIRLILGERPEALKYLPDGLRATAHRNPWQALPGAAYLVASALGRAWLWNLVHLPRTLAARQREGPP